MDLKMIIKKSAFGNYKEAFIEKNYENKVNIIFSNDNNKGKTLLIQGLMFSIGNEPIFPSGFDSHHYYFYAMIDVSGKTYEFLRKNKTTIIKTNTEMRIFESLSELKYYINRNLFDLPVIEKNGQDKIVDLYLFYQLFFIGQDKRNTSNIQNPGQYNKKDFMSMLNSLNGYKLSSREDTNVELTRDQINNKKTELKLLQKKLNFVSDNPDIAAYSLQSADHDNYNELKKKLDEVNTRISKYRKQRTRETNRRSKLHNLLSELNSINQNIEIGKVKCAECGSDRIIYTNGDMSFEVSNLDVRTKIKDSINEQISIKSDTIDELVHDIGDEQEYLARLLKEIPPNMQSIIAFSDDILSAEKYSSQILKLKAEITLLEDDLKSVSAEDDNAKKKNKLMIDSLISKMNSYYRAVDSEGNLLFDKIFTKHEENYSGSEEQEFYFSKLLAINDYFQHSFPIIIDSYRSGELSSSKEIAMLRFYKRIEKQVILTSTLKTEEYDKLKYKDDDEINTIDYSSHQSSRILSRSDVDEFKEILLRFDIVDKEE